MAIFKCKMCGGNLEVQEGMTVCECEYCGSTQTVPQLDDEKKINLFTRANRLRSTCEFDKASGVYESIIVDFPEEAEAYWGLILCKYGIEYVDDPKTGRKIPTCHRSSFDSVMDDQNFEMVMEYSDPSSRSVYRQEAKTIEELRIGIIEVSSKEEPYDIFICYKETDAMGERTIDSVIAQDVYDALTEKGYRVFFSRISLEDKLGQEYEPYIFAALNSAKVMLVFGTDYEYYNAVWVKNEWSRFLSLIEKGEKKTLIPCFKGIDAYDMPKEFARLQAQDMGKVGAIQDLIRGINKLVPKELAIEKGQAAIVNNTAPVNIDNLLKRANLFLEDGDFAKASETANKILDIEAENAQAYIIMLLCDLKLKNEKSLSDWGCPLTRYKNFNKAVKFADEQYEAALKEYLFDTCNNKCKAIKKQLKTINKENELNTLTKEVSELPEYEGKTELKNYILNYSNEKCDTLQQKIDRVKSIRELYNIQDLILVIPDSKKKSELQKLVTNLINKVNDLLPKDEETQLKDLMYSIRRNHITPINEQKDKSDGKIEKLTSIFAWVFIIFVAIAAIAGGIATGGIGGAILWGIIVGVIVLIICVTIALRIEGNSEKTVSIENQDLEKSLKHIYGKLKYRQQLATVLLATTNDKIGLNTKSGDLSIWSVATKSDSMVTLKSDNGIVQPNFKEPLNKCISFRRNTSGQNYYIDVNSKKLKGAIDSMIFEEIYPLAYNAVTNS